MQQTDKDGTANTLATKALNFGLNNTKILAWPKPVKDVINISFATGKYYSINMVDILKKHFIP